MLFVVAGGVSEGHGCPGRSACWMECYDDMCSYHYVEKEWSGAPRYYGPGDERDIQTEDFFGDAFGLRDDFLNECGSTVSVVDRGGESVDWKETVSSSAASDAVDGEVCRADTVDENYGEICGSSMKGASEDDLVRRFCAARLLNEVRRFLLC